MALTVAATMNVEIERVRQISRDISTTKRAALNGIGFSLVGLQKQHFQQLSRTGSANGISWPELKPETIARRRALQRRGLLAKAAPENIGILSGELAGSFRFVSNEVDSVRLTNTAAHFNLFASRRPVYPQTIPARWLNSAESITQRHLNRL